MGFDTERRAIRSSRRWCWTRSSSRRVLAEVVVRPQAFRTLTRRLPMKAVDRSRKRWRRCCAAHAGLGSGVLALYDVTTLYFETDTGDGFREPGFP